MSYEQKIESLVSERDKLKEANTDLLVVLQDAMAIFQSDCAPKWLARAKAAIEKAGAA